MGLFSYLFGKKKHETIWTLDSYIEAVCNSMKDETRNMEEKRRYMRKLGEEIGATYGDTGIKHAWRAVSRAEEHEKLRELLQAEWTGIKGWKP